MSFDWKNGAAQLAAAAMMIFGGAAAAQEPAAPVEGPILLAQVQVQSLPSYQGAGGVSVTAQGGTANALPNGGIYYQGRGGITITPQGGAGAVTPGVPGRNPAMDRATENMRRAQERERQAWEDRERANAPVRPTTPVTQPTGYFVVQPRWGTTYCTEDAARAGHNGSCTAFPPINGYQVPNPFPETRVAGKDKHVICNQSVCLTLRPN